METKTKTIHFSDYQKQLASQQHLRSSQRYNHLQELGQQFQHMNTQASIQIKKYTSPPTNSGAKYANNSKLSNAFLPELAPQKYNQRQSQTKLVNLSKTRLNEEEFDFPEDGENDLKKRNNKRMRRTAEEIERKYICTAQFCDRCYGSEGSLQQHIKLKHPELYNKSIQNEQF